MRCSGLSSAKTVTARGLSLLSIACVILGVACASDDEQDADGQPGNSPPIGPANPSPQEPAADGSIVVSHDRELRGAWISTVYNGTWPSKTGLTEAAQKAELITIFDALAGARLNAVFFQVRAESDAVYKSAIEPWSRFLSGTQGSDPGWDPLTFAVAEGHKRGLEVHAWLNPYRASVSTQNAVAANHVSKMLPAFARAYGTQLWMDPGAPTVRAHILDVVRDIVMRYDVDGVHFDDYFYPYPVAGQTFDDAPTFATYVSGGGTLNKEDWRRSNVDSLIREVQSVIQAAVPNKPGIRFGVSPFGIYRPGIPQGIAGLDAYASLYCDPVKWMNEGWVDYLAPQLYWPTTQAAQAFGKLVTWWATLTEKSNGRSIFVGHDATKAGEDKFPISEYDEELKLTRAERSRGVRGSIFFSAKPLVTDQAGLRTALATHHFPSAVSTPPLAEPQTPPPAPPEVTVDGRSVTLKLPEGERLRSIAIYRKSAPEDSYKLDRLVLPTPTIPLDAGDFAISLVDRRGVESRAKPLTIR